METKQDSPKFERREWLYIQRQGYLKARSMGMQKVGSAGIVPATESVRLISMMEARILQIG